ncbi:hypothetical protein ACFX2K_018752 [Malus domestica]
MSKNIVKDAQDACGEIDKETGLGWDPVKQTIIASDEWWEKKVKENSEVAKYRNSGLKNIDQLDILFKE